MRRVVLPLAALFLRAQTPLASDLELLTNVRQRAIFNLEHQPNYTCVETIERSSRPKANIKLKIVDTLRLEVALVDGNEMFAWPGAKKFEEADVSKIVTSGAMGNGNFGTHAKALFTTSAPTFHYVGEDDFNGKKAIHFEFKIPQLLSGWKIRSDNASAFVRYHGSFYADPVTFDLKRIEVTADDLPPVLLLSSVEDKIDYATARIGDGDFLLPSESELSMVAVQGAENRNHVKFSSCRQFSGESVLTFSDAPAGTDAAPVATREFDLPLGLDLELVLTKDINLRTAAIGDPVYTRLNRDVKDKGQIILPKGAIAMGRIVRLEKEPDYAFVGIEFPDIEAPGILAHMKGSLLRQVGIPTLVTRQMPRMRTRQQPGEGIILVNATVRIFAHGCIMMWRT